MPKLQQIARIEHPKVRSLVWNGNQLIDWVGGGTVFELDGTIVAAKVRYAFAFNAACSSADNMFVAIYDRLGTKGLLLQDGKIVREIDRSYYHSGAYEYPLCFAKLESGRNVLIHCPEEYNRIEIEDCETGDRLTRSDIREPADFFHSRLAVSSDNSFLLSAGWIWHPLDGICLFKIEEALVKPNCLDRSRLMPRQSTEISSAAFFGGNKLIVSTSAETLSDGKFTSNEFQPNMISVWDIAGQSIVSQAKISEPVGTLMVIDEDHAVGFYESPKLVQLKSGEIISRLPNVSSGKQTSSIVHHIDELPPIAMDEVGKRFAIADPDGITVVAIEN